MSSILITGGTGLIGKALTQHLIQKKYKIIILTRTIKQSDNPDITYALWDLKNGIIDKDAILKADAIIHLAGAGVMDKKWTPTYKKEIIESRTKSIDLIIHTLKNNMHHVKVLVSASATGWYGPDKIKDHFFSENEKADAAFLGTVCRQWEQSAEAAESLGIRVCKLRTGIVLDAAGGAYKEFRLPVKFGLAAILGSGSQVVSWIHIDDLCWQYIFALEQVNVSGSYNAVSPNPVTNKVLTLAIAKTVKGKFYLPVHVPAFVLKTMMGERSIEILKSTSVSADKIINAGFTFLYPDITSAIKNIESD